MQTIPKLKFKHVCSMHTCILYYNSCHNPVHVLPLLFFFKLRVCVCVVCVCVCVVCVCVHVWCVCVCVVCVCVCVCVDLKVGLVCWHV